MSLTLDNIPFEDRELAAIALAKHYVNQLEGFGAPDHLYMVVIAKLAALVEKKHAFRSDHWQGKGP